MNLTILHTGDFHGHLNHLKAHFIYNLRKDSDLYLDSGDSIKAGNLSIPRSSDLTWDFLKEAGCDFSTLGNRESHPIQKIFESKLKRVSHEILCANLFYKKNLPSLDPIIEKEIVGNERQFNQNLPFSPYKMIEKKGIKIGIIGAMVPMVTEHMMTKVASSYLWKDPIEVTVEYAKKIRDQVDCLIALTHIGLKKDKLLAEQCQQLDMILGGHSHDVLKEPIQIGNCRIFHTGAYGKYIGKYTWEKEKGLQEIELLSFS